LPRCTDKSGEATHGQTTCQIGIIADDLSGALDATAPFAKPEKPISVSWGGKAAATGTFGVDTETRHASAAAATAAVASHLDGLASCGIAFKKLDSLMRGNTMPELLACCRAEAFRTIVIAPAFPQQRRITRRGRQHAWSESGDTWQALDPDIAASLAQNCVRSRLVESGAELSGEGVLLCDAESDNDLAEIAASRPNLAHPVLWCGTAGLARALSGAPAVDRTISERKRLLVAGSRHPVTLRQLKRLQDMGREIAWVSDPGNPEAAVAAAARQLRRDGSAAIAFDMPQLSPSEAENAFRRVFALLVRGAAPELVAVVGGDTLFRLCVEAGAARLEVVGEYAPGIAIARFVGGAWAGTRLLSKSGAFGDDGLLARVTAPIG
jgi:uncharacterized protein YgbK (DUF1537 family)